ncbi:beta-glucosidase [Granulicella rosea]|uniref:Beta-glucosidase n=2 Tax=Granulicella rosea TaxID=474952 RepID=A0A239LXQ9_9BACT|nr:beta-glucosidase [Granulicella rosea]
MALGLTPDARAALVLGEMTLDEKIAMVHGAEWEHNIWVNGGAKPVPTEMVSGAAGYVPGVKRLGVPAIQMVDAALGVTRGGYAGRYSTVLPSAISGAAGWDARMSYEYGALVGRELKDAGFNMSLGGGVNLDREPRNGRNFEYKGEDPILAGTLVGAEIRGLQAQGVIGDIKHFAANDQETLRTSVNVVIDERSMRETELLAFEIGIRDARPSAVMCSYNKVNGPWACDSPHLLTDVLKKDFGFEGFVLSDWKATHSTAVAANAGLDMEMPDGGHFGAPLKAAVEGGTVPAARLDDMVRRILRAEFTAGLFDHAAAPRVTDVFAGLAFAQRAAEQGTVLLKNDGGLLPLQPAKLRSVVLIGGHADVGVLAGGGSALVDPPGGSAVPTPTPRSPVYDPSSPLLALWERMPGVDVRYVSGDDPAAAAVAARAADLAIVFGVQPSREDTDLTSLALPDGQDALIAAVAAANPHTVVVLETGGAATMPWVAKTPAILEIWYPGIRGAEALAQVLLGKVNPAGKLPITFPRSEADLPRPVLTSLTDKSPVVTYNEGLRIGYKWYEAEGKTPLFPFGHGLSYTHFTYSGLHVDPRGASVAFDVRNAGKVDGAEISQVYVSLPADAGEPPKRLVAWAKTQLAAGETKHVELPIDPLYLSIFDVAAKRWRTVGGKYVFRVGGSSADTPLNATATLAAK